MATPEGLTSNLCIVSGSIYPEFADQIAASIDTETAGIRRRLFSNTERHVRYEESVRGKDVFVVQAHAGRDGASVNDALVEQVLMIDAARRASARRITAVCPYFAYSRQDRKASGREPISAAATASMLINAGAERIMSIDLHSGQIQGFTNRPFDHLTAAPVLQGWLQEWISDRGRGNVVIVSPDVGRATTSERFAVNLGVEEIAVVQKRRSREDSTKVKAQNVIGDVATRHCVILDDMIDTGGSLKEAALLLEREQAASIIALATHGILSGNAINNIKESPLDKVVVTDTIPQYETQRELPSLETVSVAALFGKAIMAVHRDSSVSEIFGGENQS